MAIISGHEIQDQIADGRITIDPFEPKHVNPVSVDLTLGSQILLYSAVAHPESHPDEVPGDYVKPRVAPLAYPHTYLDAAKDNPTHSCQIGESGWMLKPGVLYLMHTVERVHTDHYVPVLDGKSSIGRLGIKVHITAGFGDPGYDGQYTLEVTCVHPVRIYAGMRFCQMRFHEIHGAVTLYGEKGNYKGEAAKGAVASKAHRHLKSV